MPWPRRPRVWRRLDLGSSRCGRPVCLIGSSRPTRSASASEGGLHRFWQPRILRSWRRAPTLEARGAPMVVVYRTSAVTSRSDGFASDPGSRSSTSSLASRSSRSCCRRRSPPSGSSGKGPLSDPALTGRCARGSTGSAGARARSDRKGSGRRAGAIENSGRPARSRMVSLMKPFRRLLSTSAVMRTRVCPLAMAMSRPPPSRCSFSSEGHRRRARPGRPSSRAIHPASGRAALLRARLLRVRPLVRGNAHVSVRFAAPLLLLRARHQERVLVREYGSTGSASPWSATCGETRTTTALDPRASLRLHRQR